MCVCVSLCVCVANQNLYPLLRLFSSSNGGVSSAVSRNNSATVRDAAMLTSTQYQWSMSVGSFEIENFPKKVVSKEVLAVRFLCLLARQASLQASLQACSRLRTLNLVGWLGIRHNQSHESSCWHVGHQYKTFARGLAEFRQGNFSGLQP